MTIVYLSLGANLNHPIQQLQQAIATLKKDSSFQFLKVSSLYKTKPIGPIQPDFYNIVLKIKTQLNPYELLTAMQQIEKNHHRKRTIHWGPRTLDIDIILYGDLILNDESLIIPHPRMTDRGFVLIPLYEIEPTLIMPNAIPIKEYIDKIDHVDDIKIEYYEGWEINDSLIK